MTEEERRELLVEARVFSIAAPVVLPLIQKRRKIATERLLAKYKEGSTDYLTLVSELSVLADLERDILSRAETYNVLETKETKNGRN